MTRLPLLILAALVLGGCDYLYDDCLYDDVGCDLPGDWQLVSRNGEAASGRWEIAAGFVDRSGYGVLATGNSQFPEMRGAFGSDYSLDPDDPQGFDVKLWSMSVAEGTVYVDLYGRVESLEGDRMVYLVQRADAKLVFNGGGSNGLSFPLLASGTRLTFER
ncbi:hypothetical protein [Rubrivirga marina]|uniref:Uncharacterized protein n=1 Tax=Rubrivirga marina TaxID=1196024 RepID=A0A271IY96_9BACT|nr:hypothetical protein [Rubrivirga marina]PAP76193.1 hypothetical protein BSZ37_06915 [Rubrivirga marina]